MKNPGQFRIMLLSLIDSLSKKSTKSAIEVLTSISYTFRLS